MKTKVSVEGGLTVKQAIQKFDDDSIRMIQGVIDSSAQNIRNHAIRSIKNSPATGRTYKRGSVSHTASSEGNPPKSDTGRLVGTISASVGELEAEIGAYAEYSSHLEFGTRKMGARPFMFPALEQERKTFMSRMDRAMKSATSKGGK